MMKKLLFALIATFGLYASSMATEMNTKHVSKETAVKNEKAWRCTMSVTVYVNGDAVGYDHYITTTNGSCHTFFKAIKKMYTDQGFSMN